MFRSSRYNVFLHTVDGVDVIYNVLTGILYRVSPDIRAALSHNVMPNQGIEAVRREPHDCLSGVMGDLIRDQFLVPAGYDDLEPYRQRRTALLHEASILRAAVIPTFRCNLNCSYCYTSEIRSNHSMDLNRDTARSLIAFIRKRAEAPSVKELVLDITGGGEPLVCANSISYLLEELRVTAGSCDLAIRVNVVSNGTLITRALLDDLAATGLTVGFQITLDGPREVHDTRRIRFDGGGTYAAVVRAIRLLQENSFPFVIRVNVDPLVVKKFGRFLAELDHLGSGLHMRFYPLLPHTLSHCHSIGFSCAEDFADWGDLVKQARGAGHRPVLEPLIKYFPCRAVGPAFAMDPGGGLYHCEFDTHDPTRQLGSVHNGTGWEGATADISPGWPSADSFPRAGENVHRSSRSGAIRILPHVGTAQRLCRISNYDSASYIPVFRICSELLR